MRNNDRAALICVLLLIALVSFVFVKIHFKLLLIEIDYGGIN